MVSLEFKYETRRKGYYIYRHEKPATIEYHRQFCPIGETQQVPKEAGLGVMTSAFQSREVGFGMPFPLLEQIQMVNEFKKGQKYK